MRPNPKDAIGALKPPLHLVPASANILESLVLSHGAQKYRTAFNWRTTNPKASIYVGACKRHLDSWFDGEDNDQETKLSHLAHARACLSILIDSLSLDTLHDDRPPKGSAAAMIAAYTQGNGNGTQEANRTRD